MSEKKLNSPQVPNDPIFKLAADALLGLDMHLQGRDRFGDVKGLADVIRNTLDEKMPIHKATLTIMLWEATLKYLNLKPEQLRTKEKKEEVKKEEKKETPKKEEPKTEEKQ